MHDAVSDSAPYNNMQVTGATGPVPGQLDDGPTVLPVDSLQGTI